MERDRGYRIKQRERHIRRRLESIRHVMSDPSYLVAMEETGRAADKHPLSCGNGHCRCCHMDQQSEVDEDNFAERDRERSERRDAEAA